MFSPNHQHPVPSRLTAVLGIALVMLLNVLAASPALHARLHGQQQTPDHAGHGQEPVGDADHECGVTIFSHGATVLLVFSLLLVQQPLARGRILRACDWLLAARRRYWHAPSHAPPLA